MVVDQHLGIALVGAGDIAISAHLPAWKSNGQRVMWIVDRDAARAEEVARAWNVPRWTTSLEEALSADGVQLVDLCTPGVVHAQQIVSALEAGKDVLVEKPVTISLDELLHIEEHRHRLGRTVMVAENWPYATVPTAVLKLIERGEIGEVIQLQASHESDLRLHRPAGSGAGDRDALGYFFTAGIHTVNLARHLVDDFATVSAFAVDPQPGEHYLVEDDLVLAASFASGAIGAFNFTGRSKHLGPRRLLFRVIGSDGVLEFDVWGGWLQVTSDGRRHSTQYSNASMGYHEEIAHLLHCLEAGTEPRTSTRQQIGTLAAVTASYASIEQRRQVDVARVLEDARNPRARAS